MFERMQTQSWQRLLEPKLGCTGGLKPEEEIDGEWDLVEEEEKQEQSTQRLDSEWDILDGSEAAKEKDIY